jgi:hypothetical protein
MLLQGERCSCAALATTSCSTVLFHGLVGGALPHSAMVRCTALQHAALQPARLSGPFKPGILPLKPLAAGHSCLGTICCETLQHSCLQELATCYTYQQPVRGRQQIHQFSSLLWGKQPITEQANSNIKNAVPPASVTLPRLELPQLKSTVQQLCTLAGAAMPGGRPLVAAILVASNFSDPSRPTARITASAVQPYRDLSATFNEPPPVITTAMTQLIILRS